MLKKMRMTLLGAAALLSVSSSAIAQEIVQLAPGREVMVELRPNTPKAFFNSWIWSLSIKCTIDSEDSFNEIEVYGLFKNGSVNGTPISKGVSHTELVHQKDVLYITAESGAGVQLTNKGPHTIKAFCSQNK